MMRHFTLNKKRKPYSKFPFFVTFFLIFSLLSGCATVIPKTDALKHVHDTYRQEFIKLIVPSTIGYKNDTVDASFAGTLAEIRAFKSMYGEDTIEAQHLDVLEAMIYLQSNQFGMASLMKQRVNDAAGKLQPRTGEYTRDQLFASSFEHLLSGWEVIDKVKKAKPEEDVKPYARKIRTSAEGIKKVLVPDPNKFDPKKYSDADDGAIYLATTAAIFYTWIYNIDSENNNKASTYGVGSDLIGKFLSGSEKEVSKNINPTGLEKNPRLRYIEWYNYLKKEAEKP